MNKIELLAPAGDLEKLKIAILYGADAVYFGGKSFSLRARANNFTLENIKEASEFAISHDSKIYVTMNIVPHDEDFEGLEEYLRFLESCNITGIIVTSMYIASVAKRVAPKLERHISTQLSTSSSDAINYLGSEGFKRVVLAREVSLQQMKLIKEKTNVELEAFIHGGMCASYSGRCMLSNHMTRRDANRGGCAHSCRWNYLLFDENKQIINKEYLNMGSKDLKAIRAVPEMIKMGISSLKIEGRMKSIYYIATVVNTYRRLIDEYYSLNGDISKINYEYYEKEIEKAENRFLGNGFLYGRPKISDQLYNVRSEMPTKEFIGIVLSFDEEEMIATIEQRNYFKVGDTIEFFGPNIESKKMKLKKMYNEKMELLDIARHPKEIIKIRTDFILFPFCMIRKK